MRTASSTRDAMSRHPRVGRFPNEGSARLRLHPRGGAGSMEADRHARSRRHLARAFTGRSVEYDRPSSRSPPATVDGSIDSVEQTLKRHGESSETDRYGSTKRAHDPVPGRIAAAHRACRGGKRTYCERDGGHDEGWNRRTIRTDLGRAVARVIIRTLL
jgi:hypothetical protein